MNTLTEQPEVHPNRWLVLVEIALVFAVLFVQGATPVPEVNEPYYLAKVIHYWNPDWAPGDFFLDTADSHAVFFFTFGWLSILLPPLWLAWFGRVLTWWLLAWSWRRLSFSVVRRPWFAILTAALFVGLLQYFHMAGEWVVGGVEAKGFAYVLVFLGLEALVRGRWNWMWLLFGAAAAFHVLVGGWSVVAGGVAWILAGRERPSLRAMWPALLAGFLLSLPGLIPAALLDRGTESEIVGQAHQIYVYQRLSHHLSIGQIPWWYIARFALLSAVWGILWWMAPADRGLRRLATFVAGALAIAAGGVPISYLVHVAPATCAGLLRFYWYRLADVAVPLGVALAAVALIAQGLQTRPAVGRRWLAAAVLLAGVHVAHHAVLCALVRPPVAFRVSNPGWQAHAEHYKAWRRACDWIAESGEIPPDARFITPSMAQTFKWYTGRAEVVNWKEIPQDAGAIVLWWQRINDIHATGSRDPSQRWYPRLSYRSETSLKRLGQKYKADYVITSAQPPRSLVVVYRKDGFVIYRLSDDE